MAKKMFNINISENLQLLKFTFREYPTIKLRET